MSGRSRRSRGFGMLLLVLLEGAGTLWIADPVFAQDRPRPRLERLRAIQARRAHALEARRRLIEERRARLAERRDLLRTIDAAITDDLLESLERSIAAGAASNTAEPGSGSLNLGSDRRERLLERADENRTLIRDRRRVLRSLPPEQRAALRAAARRWLDASPEQREMLRERARRFRSLPPEEREILRERFRRLSEMTPEARRRLVEEKLAEEP